MVDPESHRCRRSCACRRVLGSVETTVPLMTNAILSAVTRTSRAFVADRLARLVFSRRRSAFWEIRLCVEVASRCLIRYVPSSVTIKVYIALRRAFEAAPAKDEPVVFVVSRGLD